MTQEKQTALNTNTFKSLMISDFLILIKEPGNKYNIQPKDTGTTRLKALRYYPYSNNFTDYVNKKTGI